MRKLALFLTASWCALFPVMAMEQVEEDVIMSSRNQENIETLKAIAESYEENDDLIQYIFLQQDLKRLEKKVAKLTVKLSHHNNDEKAVKSKALLIGKISSTRREVDKFQQQKPEVLVLNQERLENQLRLATLLKDSHDVEEREEGENLYEDYVLAIGTNFHQLKKILDETISRTTFDAVPKDCQHLILANLNFKDIQNLLFTNKFFNSIIQDSKNFWDVEFVSFLEDSNSVEVQEAIKYFHLNSTTQDYSDYHQSIGYNGTHGLYRNYLALKRHLYSIRKLVELNPHLCKDYNILKNNLDKVKFLFDRNYFDAKKKIEGHSTTATVTFDQVFSNVKILPREIIRLSCLRSLSLNNVYLTYLPEEIGQLKEIEIVSLRKSVFNTFPAVLDSLPNLKILYLTQSPLDSQDARTMEFISKYPKKEMRLN